MFTMRILTASIMLIICSVEDIRTRQINMLVVYVAGFVGIILNLCIKSYTGFIGGIIPGTVILIFSKKCKGIGEGDAYIFMVLGLINGIEDILITLYLSSIFSSIYALCLRVLKKADYKSGFAFVPFITLGYFLCVVQKIYMKMVL